VNYSSGAGPAVPAPAAVNILTPQPINNLNNPVDASGEYTFYVVNSVIKYPLTSSVGDRVSEIINNIDVTEYFQEEDWLGSDEKNQSKSTNSNSNSTAGSTKSTTIAAGAVGTIAAGGNQLYEQGIRHGIILKLQKLLPQVKSMMPPNGGVLIEGTFDVYQGDPPEAFILGFYVYKAGSDYMSLIKEAFNETTVEEIPENGYTRQYLFIWAEKSS